MDLEQDYLEYVAELSLSILAVSAAYLVNLSSPTTLLVLAAIPVLFGYTAYISREGFRKSSLLSLVVLFFVIVNPLFAVVAILTASGNVLVSFFASGDSFKDFYGATTVPLLFTGLLLGSATYGAAVTQPEIRETIRTEGSNFFGKQAETAVEGTNIVEAQKEAQASLMEATSRNTVRATRAYVLNRTSGELESQELASLDSAFQGAQDEIPQRISRRANSQLENRSIDVSSRAEDLVKSLLDGKAFLALIPAVTFSIYALQPLIGLMTAIAAVFFRYFAGKEL